MKSNEQANYDVDYVRWSYFKSRSKKMLAEEVVYKHIRSYTRRDGFTFYSGSVIFAICTVSGSSAKIRFCTVRDVWGDFNLQKYVYRLMYSDLFKHVSTLTKTELSLDRDVEISDLIEELQRMMQ